MELWDERMTTQVAQRALAASSVRGKKARARIDEAAATVLATDAFLLEHRLHWFVREVIGQLRRTFARLDVSSRSLFTLIEARSCFVGSLLELAFARVIV